MPDPRRAFTLLELLLAITVLAAIGAVVIPNITSMLGDQRIVRAAEQLQGEMTRMRIDAMRQGRIMMLDAPLQANAITKRPFYSLSDAIETDALDGQQSGLMVGAEQASVVALPQAETEETTVQLPEDVLIESVQVVSTVRALSIAADPTAASDSQAACCSTQILFYPDGTTSNAAVTLIHPEVGRITVKLRGITGDVTLSEVKRGEE